MLLLVYLCRQIFKNLWQVLNVIIRDATGPSLRHAFFFKVYFGTSHPRTYISAHMTAFKCVTGMSCLMRKDVLDQAGGLIAFAQYIAEDYFMAKAIADRYDDNVLRKSSPIMFIIICHVFTCLYSGVLEHT